MHLGSLNLSILFALHTTSIALESLKMGKSGIVQLSILSQILKLRLYREGLAPCSAPLTRREQ